MKAAIEAWKPCEDISRQSPDRIACLQGLREIAAAWGGACGADRYQNMHVHMPFRCANGHDFESTPTTILSGQFCPSCHDRKGRMAAEIEAFVAAKGWRSLSEYKHSSTRMLWRCEHGHEWRVRWETVRSGHGCPHCYRLRRCHSLEDMQALARERGGECLSERYINIRTPMLWQCEKGHVWSIPASSVLTGRWCAACWALRRITSVRNRTRRRYEADGPRG
ncbi:hypothetical protein DK842_18660 [Chromobacterium phragmitis]|uniref:Treble clef zinc finger domain-containing protein n=1 Tax=Chromobacterium phragmitis TaxID=2202141 RepID=A0A344UCS4_9NEIS|nr:hypothetical protein DK842_18660 [Chromobacterium phragmitis]AXE33072.1 hypothetical protein DK843_01345 [Chromobacterium phragmitis]